MKRRARVGRFGVVATLGLSALAAGSGGCDERFDFDVSSAGASAAGQATGGSPPDTGGSLANGGSAGVSGASGGCGVHLACPSSLHCADGDCHECAVDHDCTTSAAPRCDRKRHRCVACIEAGDCPGDFTCDELANHCLRLCAEDSDCPSSAHGCDETRAICYQCDEDEECATSPLGSYCAADGSGCIQCKQDAQCSSRRCDQLTGRCVECREGGDCPTGFCDTATGSCSPP